MVGLRVGGGVDWECSLMMVGFVWSERQSIATLGAVPIAWFIYFIVSVIATLTSRLDG